MPPGQLVGTSHSGSFPHIPTSSLLAAGPHSGTTFDIIGNIGVAIPVTVGTR